MAGPHFELHLPRLRVSERISCRIDGLLISPLIRHGKCKGFRRKAELDFDLALLDPRAQIQHVTDGNDMRLKSDRTPPCQRDSSGRGRDFFEFRAGALKRSSDYP